MVCACDSQSLMQPITYIAIKWEVLGSITALVITRAFLWLLLIINQININQQPSEISRISNSDHSHNQNNAETTWIKHIILIPLSSMMCFIGNIHFPEVFDNYGCQSPVLWRVRSHTITPPPLHKTRQSDNPICSAIPLLMLIPKLTVCFWWHEHFQFLWIFVYKKKLSLPWHLNTMKSTLNTIRTPISTHHISIFWLYLECFTVIALFCVL